MRITFSQWATIAMLSIAAVIFASCGNPYNKLSKRSPVTHSDSVRLASRCITTYPLDTTIKTKIQYIKGTDSSGILLSVIDSLSALKNKVLIEIQEKYKDTCRGAVNDATDACNACYAQGYAQGKRNGYVRVDTIQNTHTITQVDHRETILAQDAMIKANTEAAKYKRQAGNRKNTIFILGGLLLLFLIAGFFIVKNNLK